jgi:hypothetical protein
MEPHLAGPLRRSLRTSDRDYTRPLAPTPKRAAPDAGAAAVGRANASREFLRSFFETEDPCRHVFKHLVPERPLELCKPHELVEWIHALCAALGYRLRLNAQARKQVLACAEPAAELLWTRLWRNAPPIPVAQLNVESVINAGVEPSALTTMLGLKVKIKDGPNGLACAGYFNSPFLRMQRALYDHGRRPPANEGANYETVSSIAVQMARHRTLVVSDDLLNIYRHTHPTIRTHPDFLRALLLRPDYGFLIYPFLSAALRMDQGLMAEAAMAHPVLLGVERVGLRRNFEFVLSVIDKYRYGAGAFVAFNCAGPELRQNVTFVFEAVKRCAQIYDSLPDSHRSDPHIALAYVLCGHQASYFGKVGIEHTMVVTGSLSKSLLYAETLLVNSGTTLVCPSVIYALFDESVQCNADFALACFHALTSPSGMTALLTSVHITLLADPEFRAELPAFDAEPKLWVDYDAVNAEHALVTEGEFWNRLHSRMADWEAYNGYDAGARPKGKPLRPIEAKWLRGFVVQHRLNISHQLRENIKWALCDPPEFGQFAPAVPQLGLQPAQLFRGTNDSYGSRTSGFQPAQVRQQMQADINRLNGLHYSQPFVDASDDDDNAGLIPVGAGVGLAAAGGGNGPASPISSDGPDGGEISEDEDARSSGENDDARSSGEDSVDEPEQDYEDDPGDGSDGNSGYGSEDGPGSDGYNSEDYEPRDDADSAGSDAEFYGY